MSLHNLKSGDYIRWAERLLKHPERVYLNEQWSWEPSSCILEVTQVQTGEDDPAYIELTCVNSCGAHTILTLDEKDYEELYLLIGDYPLKKVESFSDLITEFCEPDENSFALDVNKETTEIYKKFILGK